MHWLFFAAISIFFLSIANVLQRVLMKEDKSDPTAYSIVFGFLLTAIIGSISLIKGFQMPPITQYPLQFLLVGVLYGFGTVFVFKALKHIGASEVTIIGASRSLVTILFSIMLLHEAYNVQKWIGAFLIIAAVILVADTRKGFKLHKGVGFALLYALFYGLAVVNDTFLLRHSELLSYVTASSIIPPLLILSVYPKSVFAMKQFLDLKLFMKIFVMSLFYSIAAIAFFTAISIGAGASQMGPANQASVVLTVIFAALFLKERKNLPLKLVAAVLVSIGVVLLR